MGDRWQWGLTHGDDGFDLPKLVELLNKIDIRVQVRRKSAAARTASTEVLLDGEWGKD